MKFQLTSHAIDRWCERIEPNLSFYAASERLNELLAGATRIGLTPQGQHAYRLPHPSRPIAVVKMGSQRRDPNLPGGVVVTIIDGDMYFGSQCDAMEEMSARLDELRRQVPVKWTPVNSVDVSAVHQRTATIIEREAAPFLLKQPSTRTEEERDILLSRLISLVETERRRVAHYTSEVQSAQDTNQTIGKMGLAVLRGDMAVASRLFLEWCERWPGCAPKPRQLRAAEGKSAST